MKPSEKIEKIMYPKGPAGFGGCVPAISKADAIVQYLDGLTEDPKLGTDEPKKGASYHRVCGCADRKTCYECNSRTKETKEMKECQRCGGTGLKPGELAVLCPACHKGTSNPGTKETKKMEKKDKDCICQTNPYVPNKDCPAMQWVCRNHELGGIYCQYDWNNCPYCGTPKPSEPSKVERLAEHLRKGEPELPSFYANPEKFWNTVARAAIEFMEKECER